MSYLRGRIESMAGYTPGEQPPGGTGVTKLNTNENPYPPSPRVLEVLKRTDWSVLRQYPDPMADKVRDIVGRAWGVGREQVLCGNGSDELLTLAVRAVVGEGEAMAYATPTYSLYPVLAEIQGARRVEVPRPEDFSLPVKALAKAAARLVVVCNPNAPTGTWTEPAVVAELADRFGGVVVVDEAYADFGPGSCIPLVKDKANVVVLRTLSKSYSLAGLRFGYAVGAAGLLAGFAKAKDSYNVDAVAIEAAAAALEDGAWARANAEKVRSERSRLSARLGGLGFGVVPSEANFILARAPDGDGGAWYEYLKARGILVRYWDVERLRDKVRITVGTPDENDRLLAALEARAGEVAR